MHLNDIAKQSHTTAKLKGWWDEKLAESNGFAVTNHAPNDLDVDPSTLTPSDIIVKLALVTTEIAEAIECVRDGDLATTFDVTKNNKPEGLPIEIADAVIRIGDLCEVLGIDLEAAVRVKAKYNLTRPHRHGGKRA